MACGKASEPAHLAYFLQLCIPYETISFVLIQHHGVNRRHRTTRTVHDHSLLLIASAFSFWYGWHWWMGMLRIGVKWVVYSNLSVWTLHIMNDFFICCVYHNEKMQPQK
jgi:hypothetical protein